MTIIGGVVYKKSMIFMVFGVYLSEFLIFLYEIFFLVRPYQVLVININILTMGALVTLEMRLEIPILEIFDDYWHLATSL